MTSNRFLQFSLDDNLEIRKQKECEFEEQLTFLPVDSMQQKYDKENIEMTKCEMEILHMVLACYSIIEIALKIHLSTHGVKFRLSNIYWKFGCKNRLELLKKSIKDGLQFYSNNGILHVFANKVMLREYTKEENEQKTS